MTLLYDDGGIVSQPVASIGWTVQDIVLVRSRCGRGYYEHLARYALSGWPRDGS